jgi:hypothetical protein
MTPLTAVPPAAPFLEERLIYGWIDLGLVGFQLSFTPATPPRGAEPDPADAGRVRSAAGQARRSAAAAEAARLAAELDGARARLADAEQRAQDAARAAARALAEGTDPQPDEDAQGAAETEAKRMAARIATLGPLATAARRKADAAVRTAAEREWRQLLTEIDAARREVLTRAIPALEAVAAELLGLDERQAALYDGRTGSVPAALLAE